MHDLTGFQRDLLFVIAGMDEPNGLDIKGELEGYYESDIRHGRLYPNLDTLVEAGLVAKGQHDHRTNKYSLTDRGHRTIQARLEWQDTDTPGDLTPVRQTHCVRDVVKGAVDAAVSALARVPRTMNTGECQRTMHAASQPRVTPTRTVAVPTAVDHLPRRACANHARLFASDTAANAD